MGWTVAKDGKRPCITCHEVKPVSEFKSYRYTTKQGKPSRRHSSRCSVCDYHRDCARPRKTARTWPLLRRMPEYRIEAGKNLCRKCGEEKPLDQFYKNKRAATGHSYNCKRCHDAMAKDYHDRNPEKARVSFWRSHLKRRYGITLEKYNEMLTEQGGCCKLCHLPFGRGARGPHLDHHHGSGSIRGILCRNCNVAIGLAKEDAALLRRMIEYIGAPS